jgi:hypothetical protein
MSRDILIATAGVAIYPFPRTKSSALAGAPPKGGKGRGQRAALAAKKLGLPAFFKQKPTNTGNSTRNQQNRAA